MANFTLTARARDTGGLAAAKTLVVRSATPAPPTGSIPLSYNDARFSANAASSAVSVPSGGTLSNKSITSSGGIASILTSGGATINNCRVASREALRIGGSGTFNVNGCYLEAVGTGDDHADAVQCYSPGSRGTITVKTSAIVIGGASNAGFFIADNWVPATVTFENVAFIAKAGGQTGLKLHADTGGNITLSMKDVFFVGPFSNRAFTLLNYGGGRVIINQWENVRNATIVNGALVPGALIARP